MEEAGQGGSSNTTLIFLCLHGLYNVILKIFAFILISLNFILTGVFMGWHHCNRNSGSSRISMN